MPVRTRSSLAKAAQLDLSDAEGDAVEQHLSRRHAELEEFARGSDSESVDDGPHPEDVTNNAVLDIDLSSDSEDEGPLRRPSAANIADSSDDEQGAEDEDEDADWGGRRRKYYGGDMEEVEIMEDDEREEAMEEEKAEAFRLQRRQLSELQASDYGVIEDGEDDDDGDDSEEDAAKPNFKPNLRVFAAELGKYNKLLAVWRERSEWGRVARKRYKLYAAYCTKIAFYLTLLTAPESFDGDLHGHPVVKELVDLRKRINAHEKLAIAVPEPCPPPIAESETPQVASEEPNEVAAEAEPGAALEANGAGEASIDTPCSDAPIDVLADAKRKSKKKKKKKKGAADAEPKDGEAFVQSLLKRKSKKDGVELDDNAASKDRQRQLNMVTGALHSELKNATRRKAQSADAEHIRPVPKAPRGPSSGASTEPQALSDAAEVERLLAGKKSKKRTRKEKPQEPHVYTFDDSVPEDARRRASTQVVLNRGLTRYRPKEKKTPRTKNKAAYASAVKKRRTVVRDAVAVKPGLSYGGEATGININARRGASLADF